LAQLQFDMLRGERHLLEMIFDRFSLLKLAAEQESSESLMTNRSRQEDQIQRAVSRTELTALLHVILVRTMVRSACMCRSRGSG
jgi:hypothetical protein